MPRRMLLTDASVRALPAPKPGQRYVVFDSEFRNFLVRVSAGAQTGRVKKSLCLRARFGRAQLDKRAETTDASRKNPVMRLIAEFTGSGSVASAKRIGLEWMASLRQGKDPLDQIEADRREAQLERDALFSKIFERWCAEHLKDKRRANRMMGDVKLMLLPALRDRPINQVQRAELRELLADIKKKHGLWQCRSALSHLKSIWNFAIRQERYGIETSPLDRLQAKDIVGPVKRRQRLINSEELKAIWLATEAQESFWKDLFQLIILTGARRSEIAALELAEIDFNYRTWTVSEKRFKTAESCVRPFGDMAWTIVKRRSGETKKFLFSFDGKRPVKAFAKPVGKLTAEAERILGHKPPRWVLHDFRRLIRSQMAHLGVDAQTANMVLGHRPVGDEASYLQHSFIPQMTRAYGKYERWLTSLLDSRAAKVVSIAERS